MRRCARLDDGRSFNKVAEWKPEESAAARDRCDVHIGDNSFSGDLHSYKIITHIEDVAVDINLAGKVPAWRPGTGHMSALEPPIEHRSICRARVGTDRC